MTDKTDKHDKEVIIKTHDLQTSDKMNNIHCLQNPKGSLG
jgi:hypothetical protein